MQWLVYRSAKRKCREKVPCLRIVASENIGMYELRVLVFQLFLFVSVCVDTEDSLNACADPLQYPRRCALGLPRNHAMGLAYYGYQRTNGLSVWKSLLLFFKSRHCNESVLGQSETSTFIHRGCSCPRKLFQPLLVPDHCCNAPLLFLQLLFVF